MTIDLKDFDSFYKQLNEAEKAEIIYFDDNDTSFVKESWEKLKTNLDHLYYITEVFQAENPQASELISDIQNSINAIEYYRKRSLR